MSKCHHFTFGIDLELEYWTFLCDYKCGIGWGWCIIWCPSWPMGARVKPAENCSDLLFCHIYLAWLPCGQDGQGFPPLLTCSPCESTRPFSSPAFLTFETKCWYSLAKGLHFLPFWKVEYPQEIHSPNISPASFPLLVGFGTRFSPEFLKRGDKERGQKPQVLSVRKWLLKKILVKQGRVCPVSWFFSDT